MSRQKVLLILACFLSAASPSVYAASAKKPAPQQDVVASQEFSYQIGAVPKFVEKIQVRDASENGTRDAGEVLLPLYDRQVSLLNKDPVEYVRYEMKPMTASALPNVSQVYITFNPAYQKLVLHAIRIHRGGREIDLTRSVKLDLMRRERNLENNMYEGNVTAVGILPGVRVSDVIDVEYTVTGANPIFNGSYSGIFTITQMGYLGQFHFSLTTPESRRIKVRPPAGFEVKAGDGGGIRKYTVEGSDIKPSRYEDNMPAWHMPNQFIEVSEFQDWEQVGKWADNLFNVDGELSPEIKKQIREWKAAPLTQEQRVVEVLRWVQEQIRYFGIELGLNSHLPSPPNQTVTRKFGDCKDKSLLLTTLLNELGMDARPVLASVSLNRNVENLMPSPAVFDHVIVRVKLGEKTYWLDPTWAPQYGELDKLGVNDYGWVLVLREEGGKRLQHSTYPPGFDNFYQITSRFTAKTFSDPVQLVLQVKASRNMAEGLRANRDERPRNEFDKAYLDDILRLYPKARPDGEVEYSDDKVNNLVTVTAKFLLDDFFNYEPGRLISSFYPAELQRWASLPNVSERVAPYYLPGHSRVSETVEFEFPETPNIKPDKSSDSLNGEFWSFSSGSDFQRNKYTQTWQLRANKEAVPARKVREYITETQNIRKQLGTTLRLPLAVIGTGEWRDADDELVQLKRIYGDSSSDRVTAEKKGVVNLVLVTHDIASGKLGSKQLAEALETRSHIYDGRGEVLLALDDIRRAEILDPDNMDYLISEAETLMGDGQHAAAQQKYEQAIKSGKLSGSQLGRVYRAYGENLHYLKQGDKARDALDEAIRNTPPGEQVYAAIWRFIAAGSDSTSPDVLRSAMNGMQERAWPYEVGEMLLGKITPEQLLDAANVQDKGVREDQYCEAYFYIGKKYLLDNNRDRAQEYFRKSLEQGVTMYVENDFALQELGRKKTPRQKDFWQWLMSR